MAIEDIYDDIGGLGTFQVVALVLIFGLKCLVGWNMMQMAFAGHGPDFTCNVIINSNNNEGGGGGGLSYVGAAAATLANGTSGSALDNLGVTFPGQETLVNLTRNVCSVNGSSCSSYDFDGVKRTVVTEFDLVCDQKWVRSTITSVQMGGVMLGAVLAGQAGDRIGRKRTNYGFYLLGAVFNIVAVFSTSWTMFLVLRFIIGVSVGAMMVIVVPYQAEFLPQKWRYLLSVIPTWSIGVFLFIFLAWLLEDWSSLHLACGVLHLPGLLGYFFVPESPRWLTVEGRTEEAFKVIQKMARTNRKPVPGYTRGLIEKIAQAESESQGKNKRYSYVDLMRSTQMIRLTLIFAFQWLSMSAVFYGLSFAVSSLSGDLYINMALMTAAEMPSTLFNLCLTQRFGRRWTCLAFYVTAVMTSCGCVVVHLLGYSRAMDGMLITALCVVAKLCVSTSWTTCHIWVMECYPTVTRSLGYASANVAARVGGILAPFVINPGEFPLATFCVMTAMMFVSTLLTPLIPETKDLELAETVVPQGKPVELEDDATSPTPSPSANLLDHTKPRSSSRSSDKPSNAEGVFRSEDNTSSTRSRSSNGFPENHVEMLVIDHEDENN